MKCETRTCIAATNNARDRISFFIIHYLGVSFIGFSRQQAGLHTLNLVNFFNPVGICCLKI